MLLFNCEKLSSQPISFSSLNGPYGGNLGDVVFTQDGEIFVSSYYSEAKGIFKSVDNGLNWQHLLPSGYASIDYLAMGINENDILFAGTGGAGLYKSTDKGESWSWLSTYSSPECWAIAFSDSGHIFAGDGDWGGVYKSIDDGETWIQLLPNSIAPLAIEIDIGGTIYVGTRDDFIKSTDNGISWNSYYAGLDNQIIASALSYSLSEIFVGTGYYNAGNGVYYSSDKGETWHHRGLDGKVIYSLTSDQFGAIYAGTKSNGVFKSTDSGISWVQSNNGLHNKNIFRVKMSPSNLLFACSETEGGIYRSTNFGENWEISGVTAGSIINGFIDDTGNIFTATRSSVQKFEPSTEKWQILFSEGMLDIVFKPPTILFACNSSSVYISKDFGITWDMTNSPGSLTLYLIDMALYSDETLLIGTNDYIRRSTDDGNSWTTIENGLPSYWIDNVASNEEGNIFASASIYLCRADTIDSQFVIIKDSVSIPTGNGIALGSNGLILFTSDIGIFRSTDYGDNWVKLSDQNARSIYLYKDKYVVAGLTSGQGIMFSPDKGDTWITVNEGLPYDEYIRWNQIDSEGYLYTAVNGFGLFKSNSIVTNVNESIVEEAKNYVLRNNYPNPFNPITIISYSIPKAGYVALKIFDIIGREVATLVNEEKSVGEYEVEWDATGLPSGIYFYRLLAGSFVETKKMVLMK
jgi:photosystem II stability/assembly factor-like uncharacterized protein